MANSRQNNKYAERSDSLSHLNNQRARERVPPPTSVYSNLRANLRESPLRMASVSCAALRFYPTKSLQLTESSTSYNTQERQKQMHTFIQTFMELLACKNGLYQEVKVSKTSVWQQINNLPQSPRPFHIQTEVICSREQVYRRERRLQSIADEKQACQILI